MYNSQYHFDCNQIRTKLQRTIDHKNARIKNLKDAIATLIAERDRAIKLPTECLREMKDAQSELANKAAAAYYADECARVKIEERDATIGALRHDLKVANGRVRDLYNARRSREIEERNTTIAKLRKTIEDRDRLISKLTGSLKYGEETANQVIDEQRNDILNKDIKRLMGERDAAHQTLDNYQKQFDGLNDAHNKLCRELKVAGIERDRLKNAFADASDMHQKLARKLNAIANIVESKLC